MTTQDIIDAFQRLLGSVLNGTYPMLPCFTLEFGGNGGVQQQDRSDRVPRLQVVQTATELVADFGFGFLAVRHSNLPQRLQRVRRSKQAETPAVVRPPRRSIGMPGGFLHYSDYIGGGNRWFRRHQERGDPFARRSAAYRYQAIPFRINPDPVIRELQLRAGADLRHMAADAAL